MNKQILLIRHAQSANNALPEWERVPDPGLTELGSLQAEKLAAGLDRYRLDQLYCSPFRRSLDTTRPASLRFKIRPVIKADIYEQGGCYSGFEPGKERGEPGMCCNQLRANYPGWEIDPLIGPHGWNVDREYETCEAVRARAAAVSSWLAQQWKPAQPDLLAALVIHADFKRVLLEEMLQTTNWPSAHETIRNTAISRLRFDGHSWELLEWNLVDHLPEQMRS